MKLSAFGYRLWALGIVAIGVLSLVFGEFNPGQPAPKWLPYRAVFAALAAVFMIVAGLGVQWRRTAAWAAGALTAYYWIVVVLLMDGRVILKNATVIGAYTNTSIQVALAAAGLIAFAALARLEPLTQARLVRAGQLTFGVCAVLFGVAHFAYMDLTAPLVPKWLPPSQVFWGYATGVFHILGGVAILTGVQARLGAILLTVMYAAFTPLVHIPTLFVDPAKHFFWTENAVNIALVGAAWIVAGSFARLRDA